MLTSKRSITRAVVAFSVFVFVGVSNGGGGRGTGIADAGAPNESSREPRVAAPPSASKPIGQQQPDSKYPEAVTVRVWDEKGKWFLDPRTVPARRVEKSNGVILFYIPTRAAGPNATATPGSEITDESGTVYVSKNVGSFWTGETGAVTTKKTE